MKTIPQSELRNRMTKVLRGVEAGKPVRITVRGRPVADLVPIKPKRKRFISGKELIDLLERVPLDRDFARDVDSVLGTTIDEL